jgi:carbon-monoxide dehydrogenase medium subunit
MYELASGAGLVAPGLAAQQQFRLYRPNSLDEALACQRVEGGRAVWAAGTTDLIPSMRDGLQVSALIHLGRVEELRAVQVHDEVIRVGAGATHHSVSASPVVRRKLPTLATALGSIATPRVRRRGTVGGNVMAARNRYEVLPMLRTLDAQLLFRDEAGTAVKAVRHWPGAGAGEAGTLLTHVTIDVDRVTLFGYSRRLRPSVTVAVAVMVTSSGSGAEVAGSLCFEDRPPRTAVLPLAAPLDEIDHVEIAMVLSRELTSMEAGPHRAAQAHFVHTELGRLLHQEDDGEARSDAKF